MSIFNNRGGSGSASKGQAIEILMMGGKRCGKTTVLASMYTQMDKVLAGTGLSFSPKDQTQKNLEESIRKLQEKLNDFNQPLTRVKVDENPTSAEETFSFDLRTGEGRKISLCIHDIPGEWLVDIHAARVKELVRRAQVIFIAIDTPYLFAKMTDDGYGAYHREYNKPYEIANFFKESLSVEDIRNRMLLFVPIKCERYYHLTHSPKLNLFHRNYMQELVDAVGSGYRDLLLYLRTTQELFNSCTIAITPILSAGGIDFVRFEEDPETGKMVSLYQKPEFLPDAEQGYTPRFCEQPMVYALAYIMMLECEKSQGTQQGSSLFGGQPGQLAVIRDTLRKKMMRSTGSHPADGYYFIQNPKEL